MSGRIEIEPKECSVAKETHDYWHPKEMRL